MILVTPVRLTSRLIALEMCIQATGDRQPPVWFLPVTVHRMLGLTYRVWRRPIQMLFFFSTSLRHPVSSFPLSLLLLEAHAREIDTSRSKRSINLDMQHDFYLMQAQWSAVRTLVLALALVVRNPWISSSQAKLSECIALHARGKKVTRVPDSAVPSLHYFASFFIYLPVICVSS